MTKLKLTFKFPPPSRKQDVVIESSDIGTITLNETKRFWEVEQVLNAVPGIRVHVEIEEGK